MLQKKIAIIVPKAKENYTNNFGYEILYSRISKLEITSLSPTHVVFCDLDLDHNTFGLLIRFGIVVHSGMF